jgi:ribosomal-protein-alanine N-acetyltransferase
MKPKYIETKRLKLRIFTPEIQKYIFKHYSDPQLMEYHGFSTSEELEREKDKFTGGYTTYRTSFLSFHLIRKDNDKLIGYGGYHNWFAEHQRSEIGYHIMNEEDKKQGFMSEAIETIIAYGFEEMKLNRIEAWVSPTNMPSLAIMNKFNFKQEGLSKQHWMVDGKLDDSMIFALLLEDYLHQ